MIPWLEDSPCESFPNIDTAMNEPNGLLAVGGDLSPERLIDAYQQGIFPWYNEGEPILWWSPTPRCIINTTDFKPSKSLRKHIRKQIKQGRLNVKANTCFDTVIDLCSTVRINTPDQTDTWISADMKSAYTKLHERGFAHSIEVFESDEIVGGLYGLLIGQVFFGESMFSLNPNASKVAISYLSEALKQAEVKLIDCQVESPHLMSLGATLIDRESFQKKLALCNHQARLSPFDIINNTNRVNNIFTG